MSWLLITNYSATQKEQCVKSVLLFIKKIISKKILFPKLIMFIFKLKLLPFAIPAF